MVRAEPLTANRLLPVVVLILVLGGFFRVYGLGERDLWTDEAWVALSALQEHPAAVLQGGNSAMGNHTPPLYLLTIWAWAHLGGKSEAILRLTSCLFGVGTVLLFWLLARRLLSPGAALIALTGVAIAPRLVYYSKELKPYSADAFFAVLALVLVERLLRHQGRRGWLAFTLAMVIGMGFSHPLIFVLPVAAVILGLRLPEARWRGMLSFATLTLAFLGYYLLFYRGQVNPELVAYWHQDFPDLSSLGAFLRWLTAAQARYLGYFLGDWPWWLVGLGFLGFGTVNLLQSPNRRVIFYWLGPLALALGAAFWHRYPFMAHYGGVRLMLYSAPVLYLVLGAGIMTVTAWGYRWGRGWLTLALVAGILLWINPITLWRENLHSQINREQIQPLIQYLETHQRPGDLIYVYYFAVYPFKYYYQGPEEAVIWGRSCQEKSLIPPTGGDSPPSRLWLIFSHYETQDWIEQFSQRLLGEGWQKTVSLFRPGAALFCFDRQSPATSVIQRTETSIPGPS